MKKEVTYYIRSFATAEYHTSIDGPAGLSDQEAIALIKDADADWWKVSPAIPDLSSAEVYDKA